MRDLFGGIEAGGTKFVCAVGSGPDDLHKIIEIPTSTPEITLKQCIDFFQDAQIKGSINAIGIASFGPVNVDKDSPDHGVILNTPKKHWKFTPIRKIIHESLDVPVHIDTDVNVEVLFKKDMRGCCLEHTEEMDDEEIQELNSNLDNDEKSKLYEYLAG